MVNILKLKVKLMSIEYYLFIYQNYFQTGSTLKQLNGEEYVQIVLTVKLE